MLLVARSSSVRWAKTQHRLIAVRAFSSTPPPPSKPEEPKPASTTITDRLKQLADRAKTIDVKSSLESTKERLFAKDQLSWGDALRQALGMKLEDEQDEGFSAVPKQPVAKTPEQEAKEFLQKQQLADSVKAMEDKISQLGQELLKLDQDKEDADGRGENVQPFEAKIAQVRKELNSLQTKLNTTSVVKKEEAANAWEKFSKTLQDTPLLKNIFGLGNTEAAKKLSDAAEDARTVWETSQHPLVYKAQSYWDSMFAETEMGECIREFRKLDSRFEMETFLRQDMEDRTIPRVLNAFLAGDLNKLQLYLGDEALSMVKASIEERAKQGRRMDPNVLNVQHVTVAAAKVIEKMGPIIVVQFMAQQVDCLYDLKTGEVVEGKDDAVAAVFYAFAMGMERKSEDEELKWKVKEFAIVGNQPWI
ncbi:hypothetical protein BASA81_001311 [Batrachochytrium salamandrivorans]|nr:hypothetical protein BASA81_001311 [Batrachochytrium salamandrivorans]